MQPVDIAALGDEAPPEMAGGHRKIGPGPGTLTLVVAAFRLELGITPLLLEELLDRLVVIVDERIIQVPGFAVEDDQLVDGAR